MSSLKMRTRESGEMSESLVKTLRLIGVTAPDQQSLAERLEDIGITIKDQALARHTMEAMRLGFHEPISERRLRWAWHRRRKFRHELYRVHDYEVFMILCKDGKDEKVGPVPQLVREMAKTIREDLPGWNSRFIHSNLIPGLSHDEPTKRSFFAAGTMAASFSKSRRLRNCGAFLLLIRLRPEELRRFFVAEAK